MDTMGRAGVFILIKDSLFATEQMQIKTNCELIWVKHNIVAAKPLYIASYFQPKENDAQRLEEFRRSVRYLWRKATCGYWVTSICPSSNGTQTICRP